MSLNFDEFNSVVKIFEKQSSMLQDQPYLWRKIDDKYSLLTWKEVRSNVERFSTALKNLGILEGDRVVIVSENRPEWQIADLSIMAIGAISVPAYTTSTTNDYEYIIKHSGARCIIVSSHDLAKKVLPAVLNSPMCQTLIKINDDNENYDVPITVHSWNSLIKENSNSDFNLSEIVKNHSRKDTACIIYTSGTGGSPKGVMLSHGAMLTNCEGAKHLLNDIISTLNKVRVLSWLPLSHSYEHTLQFYKMGIGAQIYYAEGIDKLLVNMAEARP
ncbi:MAG: AMP-binding protein, partial [Pelagibacteraceae bacterium]|nr:AMP-binding protein [Pelagibacteraceae bacterium]